MEIIAKYIYGSADSIDEDSLYIVDQLPKTIAECKEFCLLNKGDNENPNLATIENGVINTCFKGTVDELNNAVYKTYSLHEQNYPLIIEYTVERDVHLKIIRAVRVIISHFTKSVLRKELKSSLKSGWNDRLNALRLIASLDENKIDFDTLNPNMSGRDVKKLIAFQIGQTLALVNGEELYTKKEVSEHYPILEKFLQRNTDNWNDLSNELLNFYTILLNKFPTKESNFSNIVIFLSDDKEFTYDLKLEKSIFNKI